MEIFDLIWKGILLYFSLMGFTTAYHVLKDHRKANSIKELFIMTSPYGWFNMKKYKQNVSNNRTNKTDQDS